MAALSSNVFQTRVLDKLDRLEALEFWMAQMQGLFRIRRDRSAAAP
jgi:hypothetical protein